MTLTAAPLRARPRGPVLLSLVGLALVAGALLAGLVPVATPPIVDTCGSVIVPNDADAARVEAFANTIGIKASGELTAACGAARAARLWWVAPLALAGLAAFWTAGVAHRRTT